MTKDEAAMFARGSRSSSRASRLAVLLFLSIVSVPESVQADNPDDLEVGGTLTFARVEPVVIRSGVDTFRLFLGFSDPTPLAITLPVEPDTFTMQGEVVEEIRLTGSGNQVFSADGIGLVDMTDPLGLELLRLREMQLEFLDGTSVILQVNLNVGFRFIDPALPVPEVQDLASDVRATSHAASIARPRRGTFPNGAISRSEISNRYYDVFPDDRDFLMIAVPHVTRASGADSTGIRNDISGIGLPLFDDSNTFGSNGVLQQVVVLRYATSSSATLTHEIYHRWAAHLGMGLNNAGKHWSLIDRPSGEAGHGEIEPISGALFRVTKELPHDRRYSDLELYVGGLIDLSEVAFPIRALENPVWVGSEICPPERAPCLVRLFEADSLLEISQADILAVHGPRVPAGDVPAHYRSGLAVAYDRLLTPTELTYYHVAMEEYEKPESDLLSGEMFREMTRGLATFSTALECEDPDGDTVCGAADNCPTIPNVEQDPEACDQQVVAIEVEFSSPLGQGSGTVRWTTTHEVDLLGFELIRIDPQGTRTRLTPTPVACIACDTGEGHDYSFILPKHRSGRSLYVEAIRKDAESQLFGPASRNRGR